MKRHTWEQAKRVGKVSQALSNRDGSERARARAFLWRTLIAALRVDVHPPVVDALSHLCLKSMA